jgi:hypothetical protein
MSIFLGNLTLISGTNYQVGLMHYMPLDPINGIKDNNENLMTQAELEQIGVLVNSMPSPNPPTGQQVSATYVDKSTSTVTYGYSAIPPTPQTQEQMITNLQSQNAQMLIALVQGGLM